MRVRGRFVSLIILLALITFATSVSAQEMSSVERGWAKDMLKTVANDIRKNYYDPDLKGVDWDGVVERANKQIDNARSMGMALNYIAGAVEALNDSHTVFYPPGRIYSYDFGWKHQIIGERCYVTHVRRGSDAEAKGLRPGDEILMFNGFIPDRDNLMKLSIAFQALSPRPTIHLVVQAPGDGPRREMDVEQITKRLKRPTDLSWSWFREFDAEMHYIRPRYAELGDELMILKFPQFAFANSEIAGLMGKAKKHRTLILDLRENHGGLEDNLKWFVGGLFERSVKISDRIRRKETKELISKPEHNVFTGKLIVLVDSESASASEILTRVVQLEKRGTVIGDHTAGMVMASRFFLNKIGGNLAHFYGETISISDEVMSDGKSLEHVGVTPDEKMLPTAEDLAAGRDPVLAHAAEVAGVKLSPEQAGKLFPYEWPPDPE